MTQYLLDSGDPDEFRAISTLAKEHNEVLFGATTNPTLIAKKLAGKKVSQNEAFELQKQIVLEIIDIVPGPVSAEVYADEKTTAEEMVEQGRKIASWHERVVVKLPTTVEGFKVRTVLRREKIPINNTLVFSQQQIFAVNLHEQIIQQEQTTNPSASFRASDQRPNGQLWPPFISPFVGRLDDRGEDGTAVVEHAMRQKRAHNFTPLVLLSSVRRAEHVKRGVDCEVDLITAPGKVYQEWFTLADEQPFGFLRQSSGQVAQGKKEAIDTKTYASTLKPIDYWNPPQELLAIDSVEEFMEAITSGKLDIRHDLTDIGLIKFADDWKAIIA